MLIASTYCSSVAVLAVIRVGIHSQVAGTPTLLLKWAHKNPCGDTALYTAHHDEYWVVPNREVVDVVWGLLFIHLSKSQHMDCFAPTSRKGGSPPPEFLFCCRLIYTFVSCVSYAKKKTLLFITEERASISSRRQAPTPRTCLRTADELYQYMVSSNPWCQCDGSFEMDSTAVDT